MLFLLSVLSTPLLVNGHGQMTHPRSRTNATLAKAGNCDKWECFWFSQPAEIPWPILNDEKYRTYNVKVSSGVRDWSRTMPWRAPGRAPVYGHGCGAAGGGPVEMANGGAPPPGIKQGADFLTALKPTGVTTWQRGSVQEVAWAILANHGGGYSWRICPKNGDVSEACFQRNVLKFVGNKTTIRYGDVEIYDQKLPHIPDYEIDLVKWVDLETGAEWAKDPIPGCNLCSQADCMIKHKVWVEQQHCAQICAGLGTGVCPPGTTQFPSPGSGLSGFDLLKDGSALGGFQWNIVDTVQVPADVPPGDYLLSWRWDCEQSRQIWQNCADLKIV